MIQSDKFFLSTAFTVEKKTRKGNEIRGQIDRYKNAITLTMELHAWFLLHYDIIKYSTDSHIT